MVYWYTNGAGIRENPTSQCNNKNHFSSCTAYQQTNWLSYANRYKSGATTRKRNLLSLFGHLQHAAQVVMQARQILPSPTGIRGQPSRRVYPSQHRGVIWHHVVEPNTYDYSLHNPHINLLRCVRLAHGEVQYSQVVQYKYKWKHHGCWCLGGSEALKLYHNHEANLSFNYASVRMRKRGIR